MLKHGMRGFLKLALLLCALPISGIVSAQQAVPPQYVPPRIVLPPPGYYVPQVTHPFPSPFSTNAPLSGGAIGGGAFADSAGQGFDTRGAARQQGLKFEGLQKNTPFTNVAPRTLEQSERMAPP